MFCHFLMYIQWLSILVRIVCHLCSLIRKPDLPELKNDSSMTNDEALTGTMCWQNQTWIRYYNWQKTNMHLLKIKLNRTNKIPVKLRLCTGKPLCNLSNLPWYIWSLRHYSRAIWTPFYQYWVHVIWVPKFKICIYLWGRIVNYDEWLQQLIRSFHYEV